MISAVRIASMAAGSVLIIVGFAGFLSMNTDVMNGTLNNGPLMGSTLGVYLFGAMALVTYGAVAGRKTKWP